MNFFQSWKKDKLRFSLQFFGILFLYFFSGKLGLSLAFVNPSATSLWHPTGIAIAAFLLFGNRISPAIFLGAFLVNVTTAGSILTSLGIATGNTLEGFVAAYLINRFANGENVFDKTSDTFRFTIFAIFSTTISASIGTTSLLLSNLTTFAVFPSVWLTWWLGDIGGALVIAPLIIIWLTKDRLSIKSEDVPEITVMLFTLLVSGEMIFNGLIPFVYLSFPVLVWIVLRRSQKEAVLATIILSTIAIVNTLHGLGPFAKGINNINQSLLLVQVFIGTISITALAISSIVLERKKAQDQIEDKQKRFRTLIEKGFDVIALLDKNGVVTYASQSIREILGFSQIEFISQNILSYIHKNDINRIKKLFSYITKNPGKSFSSQFRYMHKNGTYIWVEGTWTNLLKDTRVGSIVTNFRDISVRKHTEEIKDRFVAIVDSSNDAIYTKTPTGVITSWNKGAENMFGYNISDVIGKSVGAIFPKDKMIELGNILKNIKKGKSVENYVTERMKKDGTRIFVSVSTVPIMDSNGKLREVSTIARDITRERELEQKKDEFISMASHELNTPITGLFIYTQTLQKIFENKKDLESHTYVSKMHDQLRRMKYLVNDFLDISRMRLGRIQFRNSEFDLYELAEEIIDALKYMSNKHKLILKGTKKQIITGDRERIGQVLINIISNAIKYSPNSKKVIVLITSTPKEVTVSVQDSGVGIPKKHQQKVFERFYRIQDTPTASFPGMGIGLYLVSQIIRQHKGKMRVESKEGKGSTFYFSLPRKLTHEKNH